MPEDVNLKEESTDKIGFALVFFIIANLGSVISVVSPRIVWIAILLLSIIQIRRGKFYVPKRTRLTLAIIWFIVVLSAFLTSTSLSFSTGAFIGSFLSMLVIAGNKDYNEISNNIYKSCKIIAYLGLINMALYLLLPGLYTFYTAENGFTVRTIFFIFNYQTGDILRNQCLYWEPGVFQIIMNLYLYMILIERNEPYKKAIIPGLLVISTFSTTGLVIMFIILAISIKKKKIKLSLRTYFIILMSLVLLTPFVYSNIRDKITSNNNPSAALRTYDLLMGVTIIKNNPIIGIGMDSQQFRKQSTNLKLLGFNLANYKVRTRGNTNTIISIAMMLGLPVLLLFLLTLYRQRLFKANKTFFIIIILALSSEPLFPYPFVFLMSMSCVPIYEEALIEKEEND